MALISEKNLDMTGIPRCGLFMEFYGILASMIEGVSQPHSGIPASPSSQETSSILLSYPETTKSSPVK